MNLTSKTSLQAKTCLLVVASIALATMAASKAAADQLRVFNERVSGVPAANPVAISDNVYSLEFAPALVVEGIDLLENPSGLITEFGNLSDGTRTEPDENTYLILDHNPGGPTPDYDYGRHFLFQGHENSGNLAYVTRINLDVASPDHRITLLTPVDANGLTNFNSIDGSTWDPFTGTMLFTQEAARTAASSKWAAILIRTPEQAPVCGPFTVALAGAVTRVFILMTKAISGLSKTSAAPR